MKKYTLSGTTPSATLRGNLGFITFFAKDAGGGAYGAGVSVQVSPNGTDWFTLSDSTLTADGVKNVNVDAPYHRVVGADGAVTGIDVWISGVEA